MGPVSRRRHVSVAEVLLKALPEKRRGRLFSLELVARKWATVVGPELGARSEPAQLRDGVLTVRVTDPVWGRMVLKLQKEIVPRLNAALGTPLVQRINFVRDPRPARLGEGAVHESVREPPPEPPPAIAEAVQGIHDPELRSLVTDAASKYLAARARRR